MNGIPLGCIDVRVLDGGGAQSNNTQYFGITGTQFGHDQNRLAFFQFTRSKLLNVDSNINRKGVKRVFSYHVGPVLIINFFLFVLIIMCFQFFFSLWETAGGSIQDQA